MKKIGLKYVFIAGSVSILFVTALMFAVIEFQIKKIQTARDTQNSISEIQKLALTVKFHIVQIQQFLTDASLVIDEEGVQDANGNLKELIANLNEIQKISPQLEDTVTQIRKDSESLTKVGTEMYYEYVKKGKEAGDSVMKRPETGLDAKSEILAQEIDKFVSEIEKKSILARENMSIAQSELSKWTLLLGILSLLIVGAGLYSIYLRINPLNQIIITLESQSKILQNVSNVVNSTTSTLASSTQEQAAAIQETVSSMQEISSMLAQTSRHTSESLATSEEGKEQASKGKQVIAKLSMAMDDIQASNAKIESLVSIIEEIQSKTKVINDIVFKTQLLSFNASIEAARAGSLGKGFAVVADEVGKLAEMSGKAAGEIHTLLANSTSEVDRVVKDTIERVKFGKQVSNEVESTFNAMDLNLSSISENILTISNATREQEMGVQQTNTAMTSLDAVTRSNVDTADQLHTQAEKLTNGSDEISKTTLKIAEIIFGIGNETQNQSKLIPSSQEDQEHEVNFDQVNRIQSFNESKAA